MLKCLWLIRSQCSPNGKRYEHLRTRHEIQNAILFWTHVVKCIPFVLWAFQFPTVCRACSHYLFLSSSQTFEMCYLDKICLLFGYVYYLVIFHNEDIWVRSSGPVVSPTKAPMGAKNSGQIRCGKKNSWSHLFFFWGGGGVGVNLRWNIHRYIRSVKGEESNIFVLNYLYQEYSNLLVEHFHIFKNHFKKFIQTSRWSHRQHGRCNRGGWGGEIPVVEQHRLKKHTCKWEISKDGM